MKASTAWALGIAGAAALAAAVAVLASRRAVPSRCPAPSVAQRGRCCAEGQVEEAGRCRGAPRSCPQGFTRVEDGCVVQRRRVRIEPGRLKLGPGDWEAQGVVEPREVVLAMPYWLDSHEVTVWDWNQCVQAKACEGRVDDDPGRAVRRITFEQAARYCAWAGGSLPTDDEWLFAATGPQGRRYPWGDTGAVCTRASWGLSTGPCGQNVGGPDWAGLMSADRSPEGVSDLAGGVAEWVWRGKRPPAARGGSWASAFAAELRTWHAVERDASEQRDDLGVRCRYAGDGM